MPTKSPAKLADALALLEDLIRSNPQAQNAADALGCLATVATFAGRCVPEVSGYSVGAFNEWPYETTAPETGERITVDPAEERRAANATIRNRLD